MKRIKRIEMASDDLMYDIDLTGKPLTIADSKDGYFEVYEGDECIHDTAASASMAKIWAKEYATDDGHLLVMGNLLRFGGPLKIVRRKEFSYS